MISGQSVEARMEELKKSMQDKSNGADILISQVKLLNEVQDLLLSSLATSGITDKAKENMRILKHYINELTTKVTELPDFDPAARLDVVAAISLLDKVATTNQQLIKDPTRLISARKQQEEKKAAEAKAKMAEMAAEQNKQQQAEQLKQLDAGIASKMQQLAEINAGSKATTPAEAIHLLRDTHHLLFTKILNNKSLTKKDTLVLEALEESINLLRRQKTTDKNFQRELGDLLSFNSTLKNANNSSELQLSHDNLAQTTNSGLYNLVGKLNDGAKWNKAEFDQYKINVERLKTDIAIKTSLFQVLHGGQFKPSELVDVINKKLEKIEAMGLGQNKKTLFSSLARIFKKTPKLKGKKQSVHMNKIPSSLSKTHPGPRKQSTSKVAAPKVQTSEEQKREITPPPSPKSSRRSSR